MRSRMSSFDFTAIPEVRGLKAHLEAFQHDVELGLASTKGATSRPPDPVQVKLVVQRVAAALDGCRFRTVADLNPDAPARLARYLRGRIGKPPDVGGEV